MGCSDAPHPYTSQMKTILSQQESALLARHFEQAQEAERLLRRAQETDLMAGRTRAKLEASLRALADGEHIVHDASGHQHRIIKIGGQLEDIELLQPVPCSNHTERNTPKRCRNLCQMCKEAAIGVALLLLTSLSANAQAPADTITQRHPAHFVNRPERLEDVPGMPRLISNRAAILDPEAEQRRTAPCSCAPKRKEQPTL